MQGHFLPEKQNKLLELIVMVAETESEVPQDKVDFVLEEVVKLMRNSSVAKTASSRDLGVK